MKYPKYPAYKDSGIEWIGEIPEHWTTVKLKNISSLSADYGLNIKAEDYSDNGVRFIRITDITGDELATIDAVYVPEKYANTKKLLNGDILFARSGATIGKSFLYNSAKHGECTFAGYLVRFRLKPKNSADFIYFFTKSTSYFSQVYSSSISSTIDNFNGEKYSTLSVPLPPSEEQIPLTDSLNKTCFRIELLISKQQKLIGLLKEKRQAIITHAVTNGLDPNVPMKDSGIEWIGEIPEHWEVKRLKYCAHLVTEKGNHELGQVALENIESWSGKYIQTETEFAGEGVRFRTGDVLFGKLRPYLAKVYHAKFPGEAVGEFFILRPFSDVDSNFLFYWLINREYINIIDSSTYGAKMPRVDWDFMGNLPMAVPTQNEQLNIVDFLASETNKVDNLILKQQEMVDLLMEHKSSLISNAVTGKIDVRRLVKEVTTPA